MTTMPREILITTALPYANGAIHLGHMLEYIQADIWARFQNLNGQHCLYVCGEDTHGTAIMISAEKQGITPEELIDRSAKAHQADFKSFLIHCDSYYTTHSPENQQLANYIYERLKVRGDIETREIVQAYDPVKLLFLPDRYVKGECPRCTAADQYGDNCEVCGATYSPMELRNPISTLSGVTPIQKSSVHYFFRLDHYSELLQTWMRSGHLQDQVANKLSEWFTEGLQAWDISRDAPYFGFQIPDAPEKYFYVWLDAPVGYMASFQKLCEQRPELKFDAYWGKESKVELYHFIGKDIIYFHALFWPAMLLGSDFRLPSAVLAHGFLTVNGQKMSKSRGTFITARDYLEHLNPEYLRYYFAAKLSSRIEDIDLNFSDFIQRVNSDLIGKVVNIASRCAGFINKYFDHKLSELLSEPVLYTEFVEAGENIAQCYEAREYQQAMREVMQLADKANQYIDNIKPWVLAKQEAHLSAVQDCCTMGLNLFKILMTYLKPVLPELAKTSEIFLRCESLNWRNRQIPLLSQSIETFRPLMQRVDPAAVDALLNKVPEYHNSV